MKTEPWIGNCPNCHTAYRTDPPEIPVRGKLKLVRCFRHDCNETVEFSPIGGFPEEEIEAKPAAGLPYPLRSAEELAGCLIFHGLLDESAWHDPEGWDGGTEKERVHTMLAAIRAEINEQESSTRILAKSYGLRLQALTHDYALDATNEWITAEIEAHPEIFNETP